ncbi:hypothetical protein NX059_012163 [Plenodomus lindquistii]|nr:hypothetical protein NX059_012163 [Plenodomus lindquistii]
MLGGELQTNPTTAVAFTAPFQKCRKLEELEAYRYWPTQHKLKFNWKAIRAAAGFESQNQLFQKEGTITMPTFTWIFKNPKLVAIIDECFEMYRWHSRNINQSANLGWCRTMYHSLIQQLIRGDVGYWLQYAMLREQTNLISYPYYTKNAQPGDSTKFRHVDMNLAEALHSERGLRMIQGSVSLDDEDKLNCTEYLGGFQAIWKDWARWQSEEGKNKNSRAYIQAWDDSEHFPEAARAKWPSVGWKRQICKKGEARITMPTLPHGSTGPATKQRRTVLPWFVLVQEDGETMEVPEMGSYEEIAQAHRRLAQAPRTPSGHPVRYGGIRWPFPGDVHPEYLSPISRAIMCQVPWTDNSVQQELRTYLMDPQPDKLTTWITRNREFAADQMVKNWELCKEQEKMAFCQDVDNEIPDRSYFSNRGKGHPEQGKGEIWDGHVAADDTYKALDRFMETFPEEQKAQRAGLLGSLAPGSPGPRVPVTSPQRDSRSRATSKYSLRCPRRLAGCCSKIRPPG